MLDSTADIVDVQLQDIRNELKHNPLRLLYATALSRFITGLADTQIDLIRDKPSWFPPGKALQLPYPLLEIRHRIVHRHLPSLAELKRAAQDSLDWLWEWYWSQLDHAFGVSATHADDAEIEGIDSIREKVQAILKTYVKERKNEIKSRKKDDQAAQHALSTYTLRYAPSSTSTPPQRTQAVLLNLLVTDKMILPADKKLGSNMSGAFLIWDPLLRALTESRNISVSTILAHLSAAMNGPANAMVSVESDPVKEGMYEWILHVLRSDIYQKPANLIEDTLAACFSDPTLWNVRVAEALVGDEEVDVRNRGAWRAVLEAAKSEDADGDGDVDMDMDVEEIETSKPVELKEKIQGPTKVVGMWRRRPIGWMPEEGEEDA